MQTVHQSVYDAFYAQGGWKYHTLREWLWHRRQFVRRFNLKKNMRMLEVACGMGFHTNLFCRMGFDCIGTDICDTAIRLARYRYPNRIFRLADATGELPAEKGELDVIVTRGCSLYHYDLQAPKTVSATENFIQYLAPKGRFVLIIATDLSGRRDAGKIWQNRMSDYESHFAGFDLPFSVDWYKGMAICSLSRPA